MKHLCAMPVATLSLAAILAAGSVLAAPPDARCTCRNRDGSKYELGQTACIRVGGISYLARCEMNLNVSTWKKLRDGCPTAQIGTADMRLD
ncbi:MULTISPECIES: hypothetical protein [unclassified Sinorhizobium]|uniref:hypothetical protein n=1 Tax=unclassified Sinorhizobium TaxID=2613772 RepID=UPI0024C465AF|nr:MULTISPECIES: hypothetical protein [unclassified Sinorhizobium]MDK1376140.1 hypothetical protein [Sinorhizobium sp. 6-70]MDK1480323.1 hypothetical protein [Sinorhizobium sp. 6-117]